MKVNMDNTERGYMDNIEHETQRILSWKQREH